MYITGLHVQYIFFHNKKQTKYEETNKQCQANKQHLRQQTIKSLIRQVVNKTYSVIIQQ